MGNYEENQLTEKEYSILKNKKIAVIGCGSLGSYVLEMIARCGAGEIVIVDDDVYDAENIKRQSISGQKSLGKYKVNEDVLWIKQINPFIYVKGIIDRLDKDNANDILKDLDIVIDCVDNVETKFILQNSCEQLNIPLIHGSADGWKGQISTIMPGDKTLNKIYSKMEMRSHVIKKASFMPSVVASYQVAECVKVLLNKGKVLRNRIMYIDMLENHCSFTDLT